ncbi:alpha-glucan family phosphorylase [Runella slithyformis]|uniref:Alpha-glucan phosphorylase n=1 Tax=Runella slithyformis (strain ATCC 29530 / DSM 19594 / LMG 11500 / NCIMB 11436 / LSU 4) TaxID=761193 RepID=A0A7U3ZLW0_RUNSL|nr:alpha-glucan family phosphorylase [Runella slithyformis]AEI49617.1 alpha-glucan phosphorylase [Runella slithyformis DSM 19594]
MAKKLPSAYAHPYAIDSRYKKSVAYFSMEFAVDQALKTYSGGLGFLAGSHMKSAHDLRQNLIGIGILWKHGYYDQVRTTDNSMVPQFREKMYSFLKDTGIRFQITIANKPVWVASYFLDPKLFGTVPMFFLTTDTDGNDAWARQISYHLYDADAAVKVMQCMLLGIGGAKFLDELGYEPDIYHLNEAHAVSSVYYLYKKLGKVDAVKKRLVFTTHTPEEAGNEKHNIYFLNDLSFFAGVPLETARKITGFGAGETVFSHSLAALRLSHQANAVSKLHGEVSRKMWGWAEGICDITHVTNSQHKASWADAELELARSKGDLDGIEKRKKVLKSQLFRTVADQVGKLFDPNILTIVWARRFAGYKRPDLLTRDRERFDRIMRNKDFPVQFIWAGKPYPKDEGAIQTFNQLFYLSHLYPNMAVLTGYELALSKQMKEGSDLWLNTPVVTREASGTSGMTAAMNASLNFSTYDGWVCEFSRHGENSFIVPVASESNRDGEDISNMLDVLENEILPLYYERSNDWYETVLRSMNEVGNFFNADRMAAEYYEKVYK